MTTTPAGLNWVTENGVTNGLPFDKIIIRLEEKDTFVEHWYEGVLFFTVNIGVKTLNGDKIVLRGYKGALKVALASI